MHHPFLTPPDNLLTVHHHKCQQDVCRVLSVLQRGTFLCGRGQVTRAGTGLLSPTASNAPNWNETHPAAWNVPGWDETHPAAWNVPGRWGPHVPDAPADPVGCQRLLIQARRCPNSESVGL